MARVLVFDSGARGHAIAWKLWKEGHEVFCAPGNGGTEAFATNISVNLSSPGELLKIGEQLKPDLTIVGQEVSLDAGVVDLYRSIGLPIFGPPLLGCIESSKVLTHRLCVEAGIDRPVTRIFRGTKIGLYAYCREHDWRVVLKASGLAAGKGAFVCTSAEQVDEAVDALHDLGTAARDILVEEYLEGEELSLQSIVGMDLADPSVRKSGINIETLLLVRDYKRFNGQNTGGMGALGPLYIDPGELQCLEDQFVRPMIEKLRDSGIWYRGVLYPGLMRTTKGYKVLEYNCRFGDPEIQALIALMESNLYEVLHASATGMTWNEIEWKSGVVVNQVLAAAGYPGKPMTGMQISGVERAATLEGVKIFHAGTKLENGVLSVNGGRVLNVVAHAPTKEEALIKMKEATGMINFAGMQFHPGIGL